MSDLGLTPEELKRQYNEKTLKEALTFKTQGVSRQAALDYLETPEGQLYRQRLIEAAPDKPVSEIRRRAIDQITSGRELPRMEILNEPLVKIVPNGQQPSPFSPFWAKEADLDAAVKEGKNLSQHFALPIASESTQYDVYKITPKAPTEAFVNTVAPTSELGGQVTKPGGATQYLTPNRQLYEPAEFVKTVDNHLHIPLQKSPASPSPVPDAVGGGPERPKAPGMHGLAKATGIAGAAYGVYQGVNDTRDAIDTARSNREQWVRGAEAGADVATRGAVTGVAGAGGGALGAAGGALTSPVTGPVGPVVGGLATGGAAAYGAEKLYEDSRLQQWSKALGREVGELGYDHVSKEGRLLRQVNGLKEDLQNETDPAKRAQLQTRLNATSETFATEAERNGRYFEGRAGIDKAWEQTHATYPKVDKDDVNGALARHIDAGKRPADAVRGALSDAVHEKYPRALPHQPVENHRALSNEQLATKHGQYAGEVAQGRKDVLALAANKDSHNNLDQGWPKALAQERQAGRVKDGLNELWRDTGHLGAVRESMQERGMKLPELPAELRPKDTSTSPRSALSPQQARHHQLAQTQLGPALSARGHSPEQIERVSAAAVGHAQQHAHRGDVRAFHLSKDGERVAVVQESAPVSEFSVKAAQGQTADQHLERAHALAQAQARGHTEERSPGRETSLAAASQTNAGTPQHEAPQRAMA
ncbi:MAG: hypothetical protein IV088_04765 [Hydrogenophaga sp.]|uniref:hypothetical protein n=1 Tax=Hydrogenophaga sp. TaxID=1904254 RepID=UPI0025C66167|nr:hypothetical protein [Hydrogenophaga sp.]MBT9550140.1 hypothetical protein [Hydrogenophaga sp.]